MTKEEYLSLALKKYEELEKLDQLDDFYDYEKQFDQIWKDLGKEFMQKSLEGSSKDRRKKKDKDRLRYDTNK